MDPTPTVYHLGFEFFNITYIFVLPRISLTSSSIVSIQFVGKDLISFFVDN